MTDYDKIALGYARHRRVHPKVLKNLVLTSGIGSTSKVLEVGCGTGNYIVALDAISGCSCWAIDPSDKMLSRTRDRSKRINFDVGRAERVDYPDEFFELVFSVDVIHHMGSYPAYFREAYRVLRKGGKVCTVTDSEWIIRHRKPLAVYFPETIQVDLSRYPSIAALREFMKRIGFHRITENTVEFPYQLTDIQAYRDKAFSCLHLIPEEAFWRGIHCMERDLRREPIRCVSRYLLLWGTK